LNIFDEVLHHHHHDQDQAATGAPASVTSQLAPELPAGTFAKTISQAIHRDAQAARHILGQLEAVVAHALPLAERLATDSTLDKLVETALRASDLGVEAAVFEGVTDMLRAAAVRKQQPTEPLPQRTPGATMPADVPSMGTPPPVSSISVTVPPAGVTQTMAASAPDAPPVPPESSGEVATAAENHSGVTSDAPVPENASPSLSAPQASADGTEAQPEATA
jgi:hypothetical protein